MLARRISLSASYRHSFAKQFRHVLKAETARRAASRPEATASGRAHSVPHRVSALFHRRPGLSPLPEDESNGTADNLTSSEKERERRLRTDMIRRTDTPPRLIDPNGQIIDGVSSTAHASEEPVEAKAVSRSMMVASPRQASFAENEKGSDVVEPGDHDKALSPDSLS